MHGSSSSARGNADQVSVLMARARALVPLIAANADAADDNRDLPAESVAAIREAGLLRGLQPSKWGGLELDPRIVHDIQNVFAEVCASTAWVYGVLSVQSFLLGRFSHEAQADVWGNSPDALISSSFMPVGKVTPVDGGFRISGKFGFSSGSTHCDWAVVGGMVPPGDGREQPEMRLFLVPRKDYAIVDTWDVIGLRGTGSNDLVIDDAFVPEYRTYKPDSGLLPLPASSGLPRLYRLPWLHVFTSMVSNLGIGAARGAMNIFVQTTKTRTSMVGAPARDNPAYRSVIARTVTEIDALDLLGKRNFDRYFDHIDADDTVELGEALHYRSQLTSSMRKAAALVDEMMLLLGARGISRKGPLTRVWLDMSAARAHAGNDPSAIYSQLAGEILADQ